MLKQMTRGMLLIFCISLIAAGLVPAAAHADVPYITFSRDSYDRLVYSQSAYSPLGVIGHDIYIENPETGELRHSPMTRPQDLFIARNDDIYVADTGNHRIIHFDDQGELIRIIDVPDSPLRNPRGLYVDADYNIYIADSGNRRVLKLDSDLNIVHEFTEPDTTFLPEGYHFEPTRLVVDGRGFLYITTVGGYQGLLQLDPEGNFQGFYGTNPTQVSILDNLRRALYTEEQLRRQARLLPEPITNVAIDDDYRFIYTATLGLEGEQVKKLNIRGENRFTDLDFGEFLSFWRFQGGIGGVRTPQIQDVTEDQNGNITIIDRNYRVISQYDNSGQLLFFWTGQVTIGEPQLGVIHSPVAIDSNSRNELYILDENHNMLQGFKPTYFGNLVHTAIKLTQDGRYAEAEKYWEDVVRLNAHYSPAYNGLALAAYHSAAEEGMQSTEGYERALELYKLAGNAEGYSNAFWQLRLHWFQSNFALLANSIVILGLVAGVGVTLKRKYNVNLTGRLRKWLRQYRLIDQILFGLYILRHPFDGFGDLRYANRGSYLSAFIVLLLAVLSISVNIYLTSFSFRTSPLSDFSLGSFFVQFAAIWLSWVVSNYLISSIYRGEGRFKDVFMGAAYSLYPLIILAIPIAIISNGMTLSEQSIYNFMLWFMYIWCFALVFWKTQVLQNYSVPETVVNIILSVLTMILLWVLIFIVAGLSTEFVAFLYSVVQEVSIR